ncbi:QKIA protein, partial [Amia calva]|nr:QKIA protein [Amia calva]
MMVGEIEVKERPRPSPDYLMQLLNEKKLMASLPNLCGIFTHLERLLDEEINRVRKDMYNDTVNGLVEKHPLELPEPMGPIVHLQEKLFVPVKEYPDYNFVGRILGPRGLTAKQLEAETGCKIMVRGKSSMRDRKKEEQNRGKPNWEHLNEDLHVLITVEDTQTRAEIKMRRAVEEVKKLLVPACVDYRTLNKRTVPDQYAVPLISQADKEKTAFICSLGFYQFERMPIADIKRAQQTDPVISSLVTAKTVVRKPSTGTNLNPDIALLLRSWDVLSLENGVLYRTPKTYTFFNRKQLVLPIEYYKVVIRSLHNEMGHLGVERTQDLARARFYVGFSPYYLMFGREARLPIDLCFGVSSDGSSSGVYLQYTTRLKEQPREVYLASDSAGNLGIPGKHKITDRWKPDPYIIERQLPGLPTYQVRPENGRGPGKTLHRNHLLSIGQLEEPACENQDAA